MTTIDDSTLSRLRAAAGRLADSRQAETDAKEHRINADTVALEQLVNAVGAALPFLAKPIEVAVGLRALHPIIQRRAVHVYGADLRSTFTAQTPVKDTAIYLDAAGDFFEVVRHPPEIPEEIGRGPHAESPPRCPVHTSNLTAREVVERFPSAVIEITKNLNRILATEEAHAPA